MRFHQICSLLVAFALSANALLRGQDIERSSSRVARTRLARHLPETYPIDAIKSARRSARKLLSRAADTVHIANFELYDLYTEDFKSADTTNNRTISFLFADPNSNTSTICTHDWTQTNTTNNYPTNYVLCDFTNTDNDYFYWKFNSWTSLGAFSIEFAHEFSNPTQYPPPYDVVEYFTQATNFSMPCKSRSTATGVFTACTTPGPIPAVVNAIAN